MPLPLQDLIGVRKGCPGVVLLFEAVEMAGYKVKTRKAAAKRYKIKPSGKVIRAQAGLRHNLSNKSRKRKNRVKKAGYVHASNLSRVLPCLPNG